MKNAFKTSKEYSYTPVLLVVVLSKVSDLVKIALLFYSISGHLPEK